VGLACSPEGSGVRLNFRFRRYSSSFAMPRILTHEPVWQEAATASNV
jgi:hypothetical protein